MSFFPRAFISEPAPSFTPLFRMLQEFDDFSQTSNDRNHQRSGAMNTFSPKFDVKETSDAYELHGELPGIDQENINIEFTDAQTLTVKGRTERSFTSGTPAIESSKTAGTITESDENTYKAKVEDEAVAEKTSTEVAKAEPKKPEPKAKYWVSERSIGEFSRSFSFPVRVEQDAVQASMKNGILSILVPKAKKQEGRKITIT